MILNYIRTEKLAVGTGAAADSTFTNAARPIVVAAVSSAPFHASIASTAASATSSKAYFPANQIHLFEVPAGQIISFRGTSSTDLWVSEVTILEEGK